MWPFSDGALWELALPSSYQDYIPLGHWVALVLVMGAFQQTEAGLITPIPSDFSHFIQ